MELASVLKRFQSEGWRHFGLVVSKLTEDESLEVQDALRRTDGLIELIENTNGSDLELLDKQTNAPDADSGLCMCTASRQLLARHLQG